ncbi:glycerophosphodiester phosphodiesterase family protein [Salinispora pacifica]|uniref:glycerophosphodiester phosphodiesterase family protein n=1 Tax=Salinispora pacifica TaxID=351187 RepID=UPI001EE15FE2|nr:glycerophosphodiester phosphodiesterase family protein [Salinispora pacifica]
MSTRELLVRRKWWGGALAVVTAGVVVGVAPTVAGARATAGTTPIAGSALAQTVESAPTHTVAQVRKQFLQPGPGVGVLVVAHRGHWRAAPENSLKAIRSAVRAGAHVVEIDVRRTADGHLVLMHDSTVDRTTNGTGAVSELTLAEVRRLRLRVGLGGDQAPLTDQRVPTLAEAMATVRGRAMVNLDKAWDIRDEAYDVLVDSGTLDHVLFKSSAPVAEVEQFLATDPEILYVHVVKEENAADLDGFTDHQPEAYELVFDRLTEPQIQPAVVAALRERARVWVNTLWYGLAAGYTDESSLRDPAQGWGAVVDRHQADMIQTDNPEQLVSWLASRDREHGGRGEWPSLPKGSVRVQAEDYSPAGRGIGYHDLEDENRGGTAGRQYEGVDICDNNAAIVMCWIRGGEWVTYTVEVPKSGNYRVSARMSSPYFPAGRFSITFDDQPTTGPVDVVGTTSHDAFELQEIEGTQYLRRGAHEFEVRMHEDAHQNFNIDYFQFDRVKH